jgi:Acetyltransferase (GNAT) family
MSDDLADVVALLNDDEFGAIRNPPFDDVRSRGLGTVMMNDALGRARRRECFMVQLTTDVRRDHTKRFYERLGIVASHTGTKPQFQVGSAKPIEATL